MNKIIIYIILCIALVSLVSAAYVGDEDTGGTNWDGGTATFRESITNGGWNLQGGDTDYYDYNTTCNDYDGDNWCWNATMNTASHYHYTNATGHNYSSIFWFDDTDDVWIYSTFDTDSHPDGMIGAVTSGSAVNYVFYRGASWVDTGIPRTRGWHNFTFWVNRSVDADGNFVCYLDGVKTHNWTTTLDGGGADAAITQIYFGHSTYSCQNCSVDYAHFWNDTGVSVGAGSINIEIIAPNQSAGFGLDNFTSNHNIWINGTHNNFSNTTCNINDSTLFGTDQGKNDAMDYNWTFVNQSALSDGTYHFYVYCNQTMSNSDNGTSDATWFTVDTTTPQILPHPTLDANDTIIYNGTLFTYINFTDNLEIYSINITVANKTVLFNRTGINLSHYEVNISGFRVGEIVNNSIHARVCDGHTARSITSIQRETQYSGLKYIIEDRPLWLSDKYVHIYPKYFLDYTTPIDKKEVDRYAFTFNKKTAPTTETFIVESSHPIDIVGNRHYKGHLVIPNLGKNGYWVDFENSESTKTEIKRISATKVEVTVYGLKSKSITFNSIGELNCVEEVWRFMNLNPVYDYEEFVLSGETNTVSLNVTIDPELVTNYNATLYYNGTKYFDGSDNYSVNAIAPTIATNINSTNITMVWDIELEGTHQNLSVLQQNVSNFFLDNCFAASQPVMNLTLLNISTDAALSGSIETYIQYTFQSITKEFSTNKTGTHQDICIFPKYANMTGDMEVEYSAGNSEIFNSFYNDQIIDNVSTQYKLYVTDGTTQVVFTVYDEYRNEIEDVYIHIDEWDVATATYKESQILKTDSSGQAPGYIILNDAWYRFRLYYNNVNVLTTSKTKVTDTTKEFTIILGSTPIDINRKIMNLDIELYANRSNKTFNLYWNGISGTASMVYLNITTTNNTDGNRQLDSFYSTAATGSLSYKVTEDTENKSITYYGNAYIISVDDGSVNLVATKSMTFMHAWSVYGEQESLFATFLFVGTMIFAGIAFGPEVALVMALLGTAGAMALGFFKMGAAGLGGLIVLIVIVLIRMRRD